MRYAYIVLYLLALAGWNYVCWLHYSDVSNDSMIASRAVRPAAAARRAERVPARFEASAASTSASASASAASAADPACPGRRPYHTLLTSQATTYQAWQSRIMYYHFIKQRKLAGPCGEMGGFTRLVASEDGKPDGLEAEMPSFFVRQYTTAEIARYGHFGVLNRPFSVVQFADRGGFEALQEQFVYIAETDHVLMRPLPNLATPDKAAAFSFGYMHCGSSHQPLLDKFAPGVKYSEVQPVGPSPLVVSKPVLRRLAPLWLNLSLALKLDPVADRRFGWVLEMWGYSIACAALGVKNYVWQQLQIEPSASWRQNLTAEDPYIYHYTFGVEYSVDGVPVVGAVGEWSLDKRHYFGALPPKQLAPPPHCALECAWVLVARGQRGHARVQRIHHRPSAS